MKKNLFYLSLITLALSSSLSANNDVQNVNVYTYQSFASEKWGAGVPIKNAFEALNPKCRIQYTAIDGANAMFNRLRLEGNQTRVDMVIGLNNYMLDAAEKTGLFAKHHLKGLPELFKNERFMPYGYTPYAFIYNSEKVKNLPKTVAELFSRQDLKIIYQDPRTSSAGQGMIAWANHLFKGEDLTQKWQQLAKHTVTITKGWSEAYGAFLNGEADLVLSYETSPLYHLINDKTNKYQAVPLTDEKVTQVEFAARLNNRPNACADAFLPFLLTQDAQKILAETNIMLPMMKKTGATLFDDLKMKIDQQKVAMPKPSQEEMKGWIEHWQQSLL